MVSSAFEIYSRFVAELAMRGPKVDSLQRERKPPEQFFAEALKKMVAWCIWGKDSPAPSKRLHVLTVI